MAVVVFPTPKNNGISQLNGALTDSATTVNVNSASVLGVSGLSGIVYCTITTRATWHKNPETTAPVSEIIKVTSVTSNALTVVRGQDGTSGTAFSDDDVIELLPAAIYLQSVYDALTDGAQEISVGALVLNEGGSSALDSRFEGDTDVNLVFIDTSTDRVGFGTNTPAWKVEIRDNSAQVFNGLLVRNTFADARVNFGLQNDSITWLIRAETDDSFKILTGALVPFTVASTAPTNSLHIYANEVVINDNGEDQNFRVEGDTNANLLFCDAGLDAVGIGAAPAADVLLDLTSTTAAFRPPTMTTTQRDALTPLAGMMIYNSTTTTLQFYNGTSWGTT